MVASPSPLVSSHLTPQVSAAREEVPGRRGFPGYMYTDLATIYEVSIAGCVSVMTQLNLASSSPSSSSRPI